MTEAMSRESAIVRHLKRGSLYAVMGHAELQDATGEGLKEGTSLVIYAGEDGKLWARAEAEFNDGRFEPLGLAVRDYLKEQG